MTSPNYLTKFHAELTAVWAQYRPQWSYVHSDWAPDSVYEYTARALDCCIYTLASNNATETALRSSTVNPNTIPKLVRKQIVISAAEQRQRDAVVYLVRLLYKLNKRDLSWDISADKTQVWLGYFDPIEILDGFVADPNYSFTEAGHTKIAQCSNQEEYDCLIDALKMFVESMKLNQN